MSYKIREHTDSFSVFYEQPRTVTETRRQLDGTLKTEGMSYAKFFGISYDPSVFDAYYEGNGNWTCDIDCGAQRWRGRKSTKEVRAALRKCGFDIKTINALLNRQTAEKDGESIGKSH